MGRRIYVTAATGALGTATHPVGGGVAVIEELVPWLARHSGARVVLLRPGAAYASVRAEALTTVDLPVPTLAGGDPALLLSLSARRYARFALEWERALADFFDRVDPRECVVVANDVSEGPPFERLARRGFRQLVLYHVVVAEFFARRYLQPFLGPRASAAAAARVWHRARRVGLTRAAPRLLGLVWDKEEAAARHARAVVPSRALADELAACHPGSGVAAATWVVPWGVLGTPRPELRERRDETLEALGVAPGRFTLATLSRISPEKRLELVLDALARIEAHAPTLADRLALVIAGAPAYMGGERYLRRLRRLADRLRRVTVRFAGYTAQEAKWRLLAAADLFCSTSSYEAYGLSIAQALASGTPVAATRHQGALDLVDPSRGWLVDPSPEALARALAAAAETDLTAHRGAARCWGDGHRFEAAARSVTRLLREEGPF